MAVALGALIAGVTKHLSDGEEIDTAVDHERCRRVPKVMKAKTRQFGLPDRALPTVLDRHEGKAGFRVGHKPRAVLEARQLFDDRQGGRRERHVARLAGLAGRDQPGPTFDVHVLPFGVQQFAKPCPSKKEETDDVLKLRVLRCRHSLPQPARFLG